MLSKDFHNLSRNVRELELDYGEEATEQIVNACSQAGCDDLRRVAEGVYGKPLERVVTRDNLASQISETLGFKNEGNDNYRRSPGGPVELEAK